MLLLLVVPSVARTMLPKVSWLVFRMCCVTKATPIHFTDGKCHIKQLKSGKSRTYLTNHTLSISHHVMPLVINSLGADTHTHMHTCRCAQIKAISRNQVRTGLWLAHAWFKNNCMRCCAFPSDESLFTWLPFDVTVYLYSNKMIMAVGLTYEFLVFR